MGCGSSFRTLVVSDRNQDHDEVVANEEDRKQIVENTLTRHKTFAAMAEKQDELRHNRESDLAEQLNVALLQLFEQLDTDGDGLLSSKEAALYMGALNGDAFENLSHKEQKRRLDDFIAGFDSDGDGSVSLHEWRDKAMLEFMEDSDDPEEKRELQMAALSAIRVIRARLRADGD